MFLSYQDFVSRACQHFSADFVVDLWTTLVYQSHIKPGNCGHCVFGAQTNMKSSVGSKYSLWFEHAQCRLQNLQHFDFRLSLFYQTVLQEHCTVKTILFSYQNPPMPNFLTTYVHRHSRRVAGLPGPWGRVWQHGPERLPELHWGFQFQTPKFQHSGPIIQNLKCLDCSLLEAL